MNKKTPRNLTIVLIISILLLVIASIQISVERNKRTQLERESEAVKTILSSNPGVQGKSCGILSKNEASTILKPNKLRRSYTNMPSTNHVVSEGTDENAIHWSDSCRYVDATNSNVYVELFINSYYSRESAERDLKESLRKIGTVDRIEDDKFDELYYSAGAWFARKGSVLISASVNNGSSGDLQAFSKSVFDLLIADL